MTLLGNRWVGGASGSKDPTGMGRWTEICISGRQNYKVRIITAYRVPNTSIQQAGPSTSFYQQWHYLRRNGNTAPDPRAQLLQDLQEHITTYQSETTGFIVLMDANESLTTKHSALESWSQQVSLTDVHMQLHDHTTEIPTYIRGTKRIDYVFVSHNILPYVNRSGVLPYHFLKNNDHRSLYVDIALQRLLRCQLPQQYKSTTRPLSSNNPRAIAKYSTALKKWLDKSNIETSLATGFTAEQSTNEVTISTQTIIELEEQFTTARLKAEKPLKTMHRHPWSPALRNAQLTVYYYKMWVSQHRTSQDSSVQRQRLQLKQIRDPTTLKQAQHLLRQAQQHLKQVILKADTIRTAHLEERAQHAMLLGHSSKAKAILNLKRAEHLKAMYTKLRQLKTMGSTNQFNICSSHNKRLKSSSRILMKSVNN